MDAIGNTDTAPSSRWSSAVSTVDCEAEIVVARCSTTTKMAASATAKNGMRVPSFGVVRSQRLSARASADFIAAARGALRRLPPRREAVSVPVMNVERELTPVVRVRIQRLEHGADLPLPEYAPAGAAGMDVAAATEAPIERAGRDRTRADRCGRGARGFEIQPRPRSGLATRGTA
jgi:hypothetical protein